MEHAAALAAGQGAEGRECGFGVGDGRGDIRGVHLWHAADGFARGWVCEEVVNMLLVYIVGGSLTSDLEGLAGLCADPLAIDVGLLSEQRLVLELSIVVVLVSLFCSDRPDLGYNMRWKVFGRT